ncbi:MAG: uncharacterized protein JWN61_1681 [Pseudonocardiales bacterium]|nr:uncharacterized protein [Jatrophihabitantaceae bacterium]MCW2603546.1 uncharacterized protein [Pseudonocardiales bacterium]
MDHALSTPDEPVDDTEPVDETEPADNIEPADHAEPVDDPGPLAAKPEPHHGRHEAPSHHRVSSALIGALLALLGFALAIQLRTSDQDGFVGARQEDLVRILDDQNNRQDRLRDQIADLEDAQRRLEGGADATAAGAEASQRADALEVLTGTAPAVGPGINATIADPLSGLHAEDLLDVIAELRGAGAEAIQIGDVRVGVTTSFQDTVDGAVAADGIRLSRPYVVLAIGDAATLDTALKIPGGVGATARAAGGSLAIVEQQRVEITAVRTPVPPKYASPAPS